MPREQVPAAARWELEKKARQRQPEQNPRHKAEDQSQERQEGEVTQRSQKDHGMHDGESTNWGKVEQAAQDAANPQGKSKKATRKLLNKIHAWGSTRPW